MKTKHIFVPALDVGELLPFAVKQTRDIRKSLEEQEKSRKELVNFIDKLEKNWKENIYYIGMDIIGEKSYERFIFPKGGFFEIMVEEPIALNAHFVDQKRAEKFLQSLKKTLQQILPKNSLSKLFIESIQIQDEHDSSLSVEQWHRMQEIRDLN